MLRAALATLVIVGLSACAGDDTDENPTAETSEDTGTPDPGPGTIVDIASGDPQFSTLVELLGQADGELVDVLSGAGPFTVFAPTNDAFAAANLDPGATPAQLAEILTYHVVAGEVDSGSIPALADSVATYTLFFDTTSGVQVNQATVTTADVAASNGIIHIIDDVLLPPSILDAAGFAGLSSLADAIGGAEPEVATTLQGDGPFTVFAPTNDAFTAAQAIIDGSTQAEVSNVLRYHVYPGAIEASAIPAKAESALANAFGDNISALFSTDGGAFINGVDIVLTDVRTTNGIVHVIDEVLLPPSILDLAGIAGLTELAGAIGAADPAVATTLSGDGPFTVFAPTNDAFTSIQATVDMLDQGQLTNVLLFHVVDTAAVTEPVLFADLADSEVPTLLAGESVTIDVADDGLSATAEGANIAIPDVTGTNGTVHVIDAVMIPDNF